MSLPENPTALDDSVVEGLLRGTPMALEPALTAFVADVRRLQQAPVPSPSAALASLLTDGFAAPDAAVSPQPARGRWRHR